MQAEPQQPTDQVSAPARPAEGRRLPDLVAEVDAAWLPRMPRREIAGLPPAAFHSLPAAPRRSPLAMVAARLDRALPGWPERAASAVLSTIGPPLPRECRRLCALLSHRPLRRPEPLMRAAGSVDDPDARLWLLCALAGTDTLATRSFWIQYVRTRAQAEPDSPGQALWFAFLHALLRRWLTYADFKECLVGARVLSAAGRKGDYRPALSRLGLDRDPQFEKWYRQVVYEAAHQPDVSLGFRTVGWIRDFPGEDYLWDALAALAGRPDQWWPMYVVRWVSGVNADDERILTHFADGTPPVLCLLSLLRPDLCGAAGSVLGVPHHEAAVEWFKTNAARLPLDLKLIEAKIRPWAGQTSPAMTVAAGALCSLDPPDDYAGPGDQAMRRRSFVREHLLPEFDRVMDNLCCLHALRGEYFDAICAQARKGRPGAIRSLCLWPDKAAESAPILFRLSREGSGLTARAARESLEVLRSRVKSSSLPDLEKRLDLASAWADAGLEGKPARVWWDIGGYRLKLSVAAGRVSVQAFSGRQRLGNIPRAVREAPQYSEIKQARADLAKSYRYFRRRFETGMVEGLPYSAQDFSTLLSNPVVRSLVSRLILLVDGEPVLWTPPDPLTETAGLGEIADAREIRIAHPLDLAREGELSRWQERIIDAHISQPFKQAFRECYVLGERERKADCCARFAGHPLIARRAFALLKSRGYSPRGGDAVKDWPDSGVVAHIRWAQADERAGRLLGLAETAETVTSGPAWFSRNDPSPVPLAQIDPIVVSETLRDADLLVSRAAAGEPGYTSEETLELRATLVRYFARALRLTTIYVAADSRHALVEGKRAMYRVHLGSGSVFLENTRRHLDMGPISSEPLRSLVAESMDRVTARILGLVGALVNDDQIRDPHFLGQLAAQ